MVVACWLDCCDAVTADAGLPHHNERHGARYICNTEIGNLSNKNGIAFSNMRIDAAALAEVLHAILTTGDRRRHQLIADHERAGAERLRQSELALRTSALRRDVRAGNMMPLIPTIGW